MIYPLTVLHHEPSCLVCAKVSVKIFGDISVLFKSPLRSPEKLASDLLWPVISPEIAADWMYQITTLYMKDKEYPCDVAASDIAVSPFL